MKSLRSVLPRLLLLISPSVGLVGCANLDPAGTSSWPWSFMAHGQGSVAREAGVDRKHANSADKGYSQFNFDWELAGDAPVLPLQVFDDGRRTWLQFPPGGAWPAVFEGSAVGLRPLDFRREGEFMVLSAVHARLVLRGGHLQGEVNRRAVADVLSMSSIDASHSASQPEPEPGQGLGPDISSELHAGLSLASSAPIADERFDTAPMVMLQQSLSPLVPGTEGATGDMTQAFAEGRGASTFAVEPLSSATRVYSVGREDQTIRQALERWAALSGWTFTPEHWAVDVDIPLMGEATFETDFKSAVRELVAATEMADRPLQPCFYSNRVVRVVPYAQSCNRGAGRGSQS